MICIRFQHIQIPGFNFVKNTVDIDPKKLSFGEKYIAFSLVCCLKKVLFEASFTKVVGLTKFIKIFTFSDRLVFGKYLRQMVTE